MHIYDNCDYFFVSSKSFVKSISERGVSIQRLNIGLSFPEELYKDEIIVLTEHDKLKIFERLNLDSNNIPNPLSMITTEKNTLDNNRMLFV